MALERSTVRRARKPHPCGSSYCPRRTIQPGELYLEHVTGPGHDILGNTRWRQARECGSCVTERTGRDLTGVTAS